MIEVDDKTFREIKKQKAKPYSIDEMMLYDEVFDAGATLKEIENKKGEEC